MKKYAFFVLRVGLAFVFLWFGYSQLANPSAWSLLIPNWTVSFSGLDAFTIVKINGTFEIVLAILLALGIRLRIVSAILCIHLLGIITILGLTPSGVRDIGLFFGMFAIFLNGQDEMTFDPTLRKEIITRE